MEKEEPHSPLVWTQVGAASLNINMENAQKFFFGVLIEGRIWSSYWRQKLRFSGCWGKGSFPAESSHQSLAFKSLGAVGLLGDWKAGESLLNGEAAAMLSTAQFWWEPPHIVSLTLSPASQDTSPWCHQTCSYPLSNFLLIITYSDVLTDKTKASYLFPWPPSDF